MKTKATLYNVLANYSNIIYSIISGLILVPFYLEDFGAEVYGVWLATGNLIAWLGIMGGALSIVFAQKVAVAYSRKNIDEFRELVGSGFILFCILACMILFGVMLLSDLFLGLFTFDPKSYSLVYKALFYSSMAAAITVFHSLFIYTLGAWLKNGPLISATLIGGAVGIILNILLLYYDYGLLSIPLGMIGKAIVMLIILFRSVYLEWIRQNIGKPIINLNQTKLLAVKSSPILVSNIASIGLNHSQSTIIGLIFGPTAATIVSVTDKLYSLAKTFIYPIGNALLQPLSSVIHVPGELDKIIKKYVRPVDFLALLIILICYSINKPFITFWVGSEYFAGPLVSTALAFAAFLIIRVNMIISVLNSKGLFRVTSWYTMLDLTVRIIAVVCFYFVLKIQTISILPISECIGILVGTKVFFSKEIFFGARNRYLAHIIFISLLLLGFLGFSIPQYQLFFTVFSILFAMGFTIFGISELWKARSIHSIVNQLFSKTSKQEN